MDGGKNDPVNVNTTFNAPGQHIELSRVLKNADQRLGCPIGIFGSGSLRRTASVLSSAPVFGYPVELIAAVAPVWGVAGK